TQFEGQDLRNGDIKLYLTHKDTNADASHLSPWFEGDIIQSALFLNLESQTTVLFANYGVTERLDVGLAVPIQKVDLSARIHAKIERLATGADPFIIHAFAEAASSTTSRRRGARAGWATSSCAASTTSSRGRPCLSRPASTCACPPATIRTCSAPAAPRPSCT